MLDRDADGQALQRRADLVDLARLIDGLLADGRAAVRLDRHPALAFELVERFAHWDGAHGELPRDRVLAQRLARQKRAFDDRGAQRIRDETRRALARFELRVAE